LRFLRRGGREGASTQPERLFFTTDIHGSDRCFRKFLNGAAFYQASYLILGGDITGKSLVPIEETRTGHWRATFGEQQYTDLDEPRRQEVEQLVRDAGAYPFVGTPAEVAELADETHRDSVFVSLVVDSIKRWVALAEERLSGTDVRCFITPGNDDFWEIDPVLEGSSVVEFAEGRCLRLGEYEMITTGYSNPTPWETPREVDEAALGGKLDDMFSQVQRPENLILVAHPPPFDTKLDQAPAIDSEFRVQVEAGQPRMAPVGSTAVRAFIERHQPLLGLHGHVHESQGSQRLGRTLCLNPGSDYGQGTLLGALVTLGDGAVTGSQFVAG
jgi:Icc-related predicted phosphoesterase